MKDTADGHLEFSSLCLAYASLKVRILLDHVRQYSQSIALTKVIIQVAGGLHQFHHIFLLDYFSKCYLILAEFSEYSVCIKCSL